MFLKKQWIEKQFASFVLQLFVAHILIERQEQIMKNMMKNVLQSVIHKYIIKYLKLSETPKFYIDEELY